jgi:hypothetical protein
MHRMELVENCLALNADRLTRAGVLGRTIHHAGGWAWTNFQIRYQVDTRNPDRPVLRVWHFARGAWLPHAREVSYFILLTTTTNNNGGLRWWLRCPLLVNGRVCGKRVGKLYLPRGARYFGCRGCHRLTYRSSQEAHRLDKMDSGLAALRRMSFLVDRRKLNEGWKVT